MTTPSHRTLGLSVPVTEVLDPKLWRERYAYGLVLGVGDPPQEVSSIERILRCSGNRGARTAGGAAAGEVQDAAAVLARELSDDVIRWHLRAALSELEVKLKIPFGTVIVKSTPVDTGLVRGVHYDREAPRIPFLGLDQRNYYRLDMPAGVISVERIRAFWFGQAVWSLSAADGNAELIRLEHPGTSSLHIMPTTAATLLVAMPTLASAAYGAMQMIGGFPSPLPDVWGIDYTLGPVTKTGEPGQIEAVLAHWCYCKAGIVLLSLAGQAQAKGISSASLSMDGISKSVALTNSVMYGINSAYEIRLKEAEEAIDWKALMMYKRGLRVRPYGG